eukprot:snap_masked-scaffold_13-processed-gene-7.24-mRNA-1 protein AED:1.00 eAED:1.00 QI:0/-1/0/0/-1/1/1/0/551
MLGARHLNLPRIKQVFMNNRAGLKSFTKKQAVVHKQELSKNKRNKNNRVFQIKVGKIGSSRKDISLSLKNIHSNEFEHVQGIADTGASSNVSSLKLMRNYSIKEEEPRYIKQVELLDGKVLPIKKVITARAKLSQGETQFNLGLQRFFCIDVPTWSDYIIAKKTLDYFDITLDLTKTDRSKAKKYEIGKEDSQLLGPTTSIQAKDNFKVLFIQNGDVRSLLSQHSQINIQDFLFIIFNSSTSEWIQNFNILYSNGFRLADSIIDAFHVSSFKQQELGIFLHPDCSCFIFVKRSTKVPGLIHQSNTDVHFIDPTFYNYISIILQKMIPLADVKIISLSKITSASQPKSKPISLSKSNLISLSNSNSTFLSNSNSISLSNSNSVSLFNPKPISLSSSNSISLSNSKSIPHSNSNLISKSNSSLISKSNSLSNETTQRELVGVIKPIPIEDVDSEHFKQLDDDPSPSEVTPLVIQNLVDNIPEEFNEVGIGEGAIEGEVENNILTQMIQEKLDESIFNAEKKYDLKAILLKGIPAFGVKHSNARMGNLTPIDVE